MIDTNKATAACHIIRNYCPLLARQATAAISAINGGAPNASIRVNRVVTHALRDYQWSDTDRAILRAALSRRDTYIQARVSADELAIVQDKANAVGASVSDYLRAAVGL